MSETFHNILALDTAMSGCSVCVLRGDEAFVRSEDMPRGQAVHLVPMMNDVIAQAGITHADLDAVVTTNGPGAFTGLRIGLSAAKATGLALDIPVFGVTTLQALALSCKARGDFTVLVETRRAELYVQPFDEVGKALCDAALMALDDIAQAPLYIGDGASRYRESYSCAVVDEGYILPDVEVMARALNVQPALFVKNPDAVYLRGADVSQSKRKQRVIAT